MIAPADIVISRIEVPVKDGTIMPAYVARPADARATPGILVLQDQFGVTDFLRDTADRFARLGFTAIAPALYHRTGVFELPYAGGYEQNKAHHKGVTWEGQIADAEAAFDWLVRDGGVAAGRIGAMGFCMGGRLAYLANAHRPLRAAISFYGGRIAPDLLTYAGGQQGPLLFFWGGQDDVIPKEQYRAVADGLDAAGVAHDQVVFSDAKHAFFCHPRPELYHERSADTAWAMSLAFLHYEGVAPDLASAGG
jgi:carboxymethylenebutenolidase